MDIQDFQALITHYINQSNDKQNIELEALLKNSFYKYIDAKDFTNILKRVKAIPNIKFKKTESLDINYEWEPGKQSNIRVSILGRDSIKKYCSNESVKDISQKNIMFTRKRKTKINSIDDDEEISKIAKPIDINDYGIRFNLKTEDILGRDHEHIRNIFDNWGNKRKTFRYKNRLSFKTDDSNFSIDLTVVKVSEYIITEDGPRKIYKNRYSKSLKDSKTLTSKDNFEVEVEYIGNKKKTLPTEETVLEGFKKYLGIILQAYQQSYFIIKKSDIIKVKDQYTSLLKARYKGFHGPNNITLERKHVIKYKYADYDNIISIRRNYSVTDKADGERNMLIIIDDGRIFIINRKDHIRYLGATILEYANTIIDGEYIIKNKNRENINSYMAFDIYIHKSIDVRDKPLFRTPSEIEGNSSNKSRYEILEELRSTLHSDNFNHTEANNNLSIGVKKFYWGDVEKYNEETQSLIDTTLNTLETEEDPNAREVLQKNLQVYDQDSDIFKHINTILDNEKRGDFIYKIDGLIFTPINLAVGENPGQSAKFNGRWLSSFKWKPPEENTIDFFVMFEKDIETSKDVEVWKTDANGKAIRCKVAILHVGYDPEIHTYQNSCRVLNENLSFKIGYYPTPFFPVNPYKKNIHIAHLPISNDSIKCQDHSIIRDRSIVEFSYNYDNDDFHWNPLRVREIDMPNAFDTASNVWKSINNPISEDIIRNPEGLKDDTLTNYETSDPQDDTQYYKGAKKRKEYLSKPMNDFHNLVKKNLIVKNSVANGNLIDFSCGKLGDLNHWLESGTSNVVGIDINIDNLINKTNGACVRVINRLSSDSKSKSNSPSKKHPLLNNVFLIWGDSTKNILNSEAAKDDLNKYYLDIIYANPRITVGSIKNKKLASFYGMGTTGFDIASCQFSIHYFFENIDKLKTFLSNVSSSLKPNGKFIGTCLNGKKVLELLGSNSFVVGQIENNKIWRIDKKYDIDSLSDSEESLGKKIDVYFETINQTISEYLVNLDYLQIVAANYGLDLITIENFDSIFRKLEGEKYGDMEELKMAKNDKLRDYSFLNSTFAFVKKS